MVKDDADRLGEPIRTVSLVGYARSADQLLRFAADAVRSFYVSPAHFTLSEKRFAGFIRDSLTEAIGTEFSTGGAAVTADLWELDDLVPSFVSIDANEPLKDLLACRADATEGLAGNVYDIRLSGTFGNPSPLTASHIAYQVAGRGDLTERGIIFGILTLGSCCNGWPSLEHAERPHPYVAYRVFRAAEVLLRNGHSAAMLINALRDDESLLDRAKVYPRSAVKDALETAVDALEQSPIELVTLRGKFRRLANEYLREQHSRSGDAFSSLSYDPVGACFGLDLLVGASNGYQEVGDIHDFSRRLGEHGDLIAVTVRHVLHAMTPNGSLPYGLRPFSR